MKVSIKILRQFDSDLLMLREAGYSLSRLMRDSVSAFANGRNLKIHFDRADPNRFVFTDMKSYRFNLNFDDEDTKVAELLSHVEPRFKSAFCKTILRNALATENICVFVDNKEAVNKLLYEDVTDVSIGRYILKGGHGKTAGRLKFYGDDADDINYTDDFTGEETPETKAEKPEASDDKKPDRPEIKEKPSETINTDVSDVPKPSEEKPSVKHFDIPQIETVIKPPVIKEEKGPSSSDEKTSDDSNTADDTKTGTPAFEENKAVPGPKPEEKPKKAEDTDSDGSAPDEGIVYVDDSGDDDLSEEALLDAFDKL